jgi:hypothetical protein
MWICQDLIRGSPLTYVMPHSFGSFSWGKKTSQTSASHDYHSSGANIRPLTTPRLPPWAFQAFSNSHNQIQRVCTALRACLLHTRAPRDAHFSFRGLPSACFLPLQPLSVAFAQLLLCHAIITSPSTSNLLCRSLL